MKKGLRMESFFRWKHNQDRLIGQNDIEQTIQKTAITAPTF